jgi:uncharacterized membrane protein YedE/YeeE
MNKSTVAFLAGMVFGIGLLVAQMTNPAKVIGFLDITGNWDPSLALVMGGALAVFAAAYWRSRRPGSRPALDTQFYVPDKRSLDWQLLVGSLLFGAGWGLSGFCPGPAIVSAGFGEVRVWVFIVSMAAGVTVYNATIGRRVK